MDMEKIENRYPNIVKKFKMISTQNTIIRAGAILGFTGLGIITGGSVLHTTFNMTSKTKAMPKKALIFSIGVLGQLVIDDIFLKGTDVIYATLNTHLMERYAPLSEELGDTDEEHSVNATGDDDGTNDIDIFGPDTEDEVPEPHFDEVTPSKDVMDQIIRGTTVDCVDTQSRIDTRTGLNVGSSVPITETLDSSDTPNTSDAIDGPDFGTRVSRFKKSHFHKD